LALAVLTNRALVLDFGPRANDTEAGLLLPQRFDWRLPAVWPHGWSPFSELQLGEAAPTLGVVGSGGGIRRPLRKEGTRVLYHNQQFGAVAPNQLWPHVQALVLDGQNHDASKALFSNRRLDELTAAALLTPLDASSWPACALRSLFT
jgi:hypothetical protein